MQSGKGTEGMPEEGINKQWQAEKVILGGFNLTIKFLAMHVAYFSQKTFKSFSPVSIYLCAYTLCGVSCLLDVQIYWGHGCGEFKKLRHHSWD